MSKKRGLLKRLLTLMKYGLILATGGLLLWVALYFLWLREWQMTWGATDEEVSQYMAGDELFDDPGFNATRAVEIKAIPEQIWPWIMQMGYGRGGFYSFDKLDNGGMPSAETILGQYQDLKLGDSIPLGGAYMQITHIKTNESLLWVFLEGPWCGATWSWGVYPVDSCRTRLVSRVRNEHNFSNLEHAIAWTMVDVFEIVMMRECLLGIKRRAETTAGST